MNPPELSEQELTIISEQSGVDTDVIKSWYKDFLSVCPKGKMDKKNFVKFYKLLRGQEGDYSKITDNLFACFDKDANGYLDFSEFLIAYASTSNGDLRRRLEFVFMFYDKDKDGYINDKEFLHGIEAIYNFRGKNKKEYPPAQCVKDIFNRIDDNGDRKLTKHEFIEACLKNETLNELLSPFEFS